MLSIEHPDAPVATPERPEPDGFSRSVDRSGLSWVIVFQNSLSLALGAMIVCLWARLKRQRADAFAIPVASGFIAGESLIAAFIAIACTRWGCWPRDRSAGYKPVLAL